MTYTAYSAILTNLGKPDISVLPPDDTDEFNFALVPVGKSFKGWIDKDSPFLDMEIPLDARWVYSVYVIVETGDRSFPLKAGEHIGGPFLDIEEAESLARKVGMSGWFVCIYAALIVGDKSKLN